MLSLYIHQLRQKLKDGESEHKYIQTEWGQGYRFAPLLKTEKPATNPVPPIAEQEGTVEKISKTNSTFRWTWLLLIIPLLIILLNLKNFSGLFTSPVDGGTTLKVEVTAEGILNGIDAGLVHGQICITNQGKYTTENLSILDTVRVIEEQQSTFTSTFIDLSHHPVINPQEKHCYPYKVEISSIPNKDTEYHNRATITITNYSGMTIGSDQCPGPTPCPFGPTVIVDFSLTEP